MVEKVYAPEIVEGFSLRLPVTLRKRVHKSAIANRRSMNAEILVLMERALAEAEAKQGEAA